MENFSCRHSLHVFSLGAYGCTFFIISHLMLQSVFFFFNFQMWSLRVVVALFCSSLNDDLCRLNLVLNSFAVSSMYVSCFFVSVSVTVALYTTHLVRHFPSSGQLFVFFFAGSYTICHFGVIPSFCVFEVGGCFYWVSFVLHLGGSCN